MKINGVFLSIAVATLLIESRVNLLAQEVPNDVTIKQQRIQKLKELRQSDELALRSKIHPDIRQKIASGENVLVIVHLDVLLKRITNPTQADDLVSKNLIVLAQEELLSALGQRRYKIMRRYENFPLIALEIGSDALDVLDTSPLVLRESRMNKAALNQTVPLVGAPQVWAPINDSGQIVGYYWDDSDNYFGFVWLLW